MRSTNTCKNILRQLSRGPSSSNPSHVPQHASSSNAFRISPGANSTTRTVSNQRIGNGIINDASRSTPLSSSSTIHTSINSTRTLSRRAISSDLRSQTHHNTIRSALAMEGSSLRYALLLSGEGEEALLRGWDAGVATLEDDDGT